jgi:uncharacterized SAM-binding protein YcdF (DUF218 family)
MKPIISKEPGAPDFSEKKIKDLTEIVFGEKKKKISCDALFVFSGTHPGHWKKAIEAYKKGYCSEIIVTGGKSLTGVPHPDWPDDSVKEADVIISQLLKAGIQQEKVFHENQSTNSLENVLYAKGIYDFTRIQRLMYICKSHVAGRQERTLRKHLGEHLEFIPFAFDAEYQGVVVNRGSWSETETGRNRVWGEFLRIITYGEKGDISPL